MHLNIRLSVSLRVRRFDSRYLVKTPAEYILILHTLIDLFLATNMIFKLAITY